MKHELKSIYFFSLFNHTRVSHLRQTHTCGGGENSHIMLLWQFRPPSSAIKVPWTRWIILTCWDDKVLSRIHFQNELKLVDFIALNVCVIICMRTPHKCSLTLLFPASTFLSLSSTYSNYRLQYAIYLAIYCWLVSISVLKMCLFNTERCNGKQLMVRRYRWSGVSVYMVWYNQHATSEQSLLLLSSCFTFTPLKEYNNNVDWDWERERRKRSRWGQARHI